MLTQANDVIFQCLPIQIKYFSIVFDVHFSPHTFRKLPPPLLRPAGIGSTASQLFEVSNRFPGHFLLDISKDSNYYKWRSKGFTLMLIL